MRQPTIFLILITSSLFIQPGKIIAANITPVVDQVKVTANDTSSDIIRKIQTFKAVWTSPPAKTPANYAIDGPLMGNGDIGVCIGGQTESLRFYLSKNDFWRLKSKAGQSSPKIFGYLDIAIENLKGADYHVAQSIFDGVTTGTFKRNALTVEVKSRVAATDNILLVELSTQGENADVQVKLSPAEGSGSESLHEGSGPLYWAVRKFEKDVDIPTEAAAAMKIFGAPNTAFTLKPNQSVTLAIYMTSRFKHKKPLEQAKQSIAKIDSKAIQQLQNDHEHWWSQYWNQSWIDIDNPTLEKHYYQSLYSMAAASRDPKFPPSIFGTWITTDSPHWAGDYHLNYNHMAPYYALYSTNRITQADPQDAPILDFRKRGQWYAQNITQTRGVLYPVGIGPLGIETTFEHDRYKNSPNQEKGGLFFQQRSNSAYCLVNIAQRWRTTYDLVYAEIVYPLIKDVADFWQDYLKFENGRYVIYGDAIHEGSGQNANPILSLGLIYNTFDLALDISTELNLDVDCRRQWQHIIENLSGFSTQQKNGKTVFRYTEKGTAWWNDNTLGIQHIYPGNTIGLDSDPRLLDIAHNTITVMNRWRDFNGTNSFYPAAVRVGYNPSIILQKLKEYAADTYPNGFQRNNSHGIENFSTTPNTLNMMLCMSHVPVGNAHLQGKEKEKFDSRPESVIRLFPVWPKEQNARFENIRCWGAFLVSSELKNGKVQFVKIHSEQGRQCTLENPWPEKTVTLYRHNKPTQKLTGQRFSFKTKKGEALMLVPYSTQKSKPESIK